MRAFEKDIVKNYARGNYNLLMRNLCPELAHALAKPGRHVPDPYRGSKSKDGYRVFPDFNYTGASIFNSSFGVGGKKLDFFELLKVTQKVTDFYEALELVGTFLNCPRTGHIIKGTGTNNLEYSEEKLAQIRENTLMYAKQLEQDIIRETKDAYIKNKEKISYILNKSFSIYDSRASVVWKYFEKRGLSALKNTDKAFLDNLLFTPNCAYYEDGQFVGKFDTLTSKVFNSEERLWSLHRTYLLPDGKKANVNFPKKLMSPIYADQHVCKYIKMGNVPSHGVIGIAEGIETALSCHIAVGIPVYATVSASFMEGFIPPKGVKAVVVFADLDSSKTGELAARKAINNIRSLGVKAFICLPKEVIPDNSKGVDWNDVLKTKGISGFPNCNAMMDFIAKH